MHQHLIDCETENCDIPLVREQPTASVEVSADNPAHVADVAKHALDVVAELHRQEEETERTHAIAAGAVEVAKLQASIPAPDEHETSAEHEEQEAEIEVDEPDEPDDEPDEIEEVVPPGEVTDEPPPAEDERHADDGKNEHDEHEHEHEHDEHVRRRKRFGRR